ncbi:MAG: hypothetical protein U9N51_03125 [Bacteroidota bacterium]|nr:hypothetical protein [Bacteroidota bacterium]
MENKTLQAQENMEIISRMIESRKSNWNDNGHILRFWGWLILLASIGHFTLFELGCYNFFWTTWLITIPGAIYSLIYFTRLKKKHGKSGFLDKLSGFLWWTFAINTFIIGFGFTFSIGHLGTGIILLLLGFAATIEGRIMRFRPMIICGFITNFLGFFTLTWMVLYYKEIVSTNNFIILLVGLGITFTNLIPGYIMKYEFKRKA